MIDRAVEQGALPQAPKEGTCSGATSAACAGRWKRTAPGERDRPGRARGPRGAAGDAMSAPRRRGRSRAHPHVARRDVRRGGGRRHRQDDRARRPHRQRPRVRARRRSTSIVAVTFTEKAAGELKLRLRAELEARRQHAAEAARRRTRPRSPPRSRNLEQAHVSTIHAFCADLLRERPVEAGVDPRFAMLTDPQAQALFGGVFRDWLQARARGAATRRPPRAAAAQLRRRADRPAREGRVDAGRLARLHRALGEWRVRPGRPRRRADRRGDRVRGDDRGLHER